MFLFWERHCAVGNISHVHFLRGQKNTIHRRNIWNLHCLSSVLENVEHKKLYFISAPSFLYLSKVFGYVSAGSRSVHASLA